MSLSKEHYQYNLTCRRITLSKQCIQAVETKMKQIEEVQSELTESRSLRFSETASLKRCLQNTTIESGNTSMTERKDLLDNTAKK